MEMGSRWIEFVIYWQDDKMKRILIVTNLFGNNRQGYDLADCLRSAGHKVRLVQYTDTSEQEVGNIGVRFVKPQGRFSKFHVFINGWRMFVASIFCRKDIVICIGKTNLFLCALYKILFGSMLVYYALEYVRYGWLSAAIVRCLVDKYIDVEESRLRRVAQDLRINKPSMVVYKMPKLTERKPESGRLRAYLKKNFFATGDEKLIVYAGSYQKYACLENIVKASDSFPDNIWLVLMVSWGLPPSMAHSTKHCKIVPAQHGEEFFDWLSDADCSLLPYEDKSDFNVENCSPQKLFDCYYVGVPYLGSMKPLIKKVLSKYPNAGILCDFTNVEQIEESVRKAVMLKTANVSKIMHDLYRSELNYNRNWKRIQAFVCDEI